MTGDFPRRTAIVFLPSPEHRWALAGSVLAMVLVAMLVSVMNENIAQAQLTRVMAAQQSQERGRCTAMLDRRERDQCLLDLRLGEQANMASR